MKLWAFFNQSSFIDLEATTMAGLIGISIGTGLAFLLFCLCTALQNIRF
jgi:hypothetical protein